MIGVGGIPTASVGHRLGASGPCKTSRVSLFLPRRRAKEGGLGGGCMSASRKTPSELRRQREGLPPAGQVFGNHFVACSSARCECGAIIPDAWGSDLAQRANGVFAAWFIDGFGRSRSTGDFATAVCGGALQRACASMDVAGRAAGRDRDLMDFPDTILAAEGSASIPDTSCCFAK